MFRKLQFVVSLTILILDIFYVKTEKISEVVLSLVILFLKKIYE